MGIASDKNKAGGDQREHQEDNLSEPRPTADELKAFSQLDLHPGYLRLQGLRSILDDPYFVEREGISQSEIRSDGEGFVNFAGYNYLGLSGHPEVCAAAKEAIDQYGTSVSASRFVSGQIPLHAEFEAAIAQFLGVQDSVAFVSGYGTNVTVIGHMFSRHDLLIHDELAHNSLVTGCRLSGARRLSFNHNDLDHLDQLLAEHRDKAQRACIVVEGLYSMDGDIPDLPALIEIKQRYHALLMIDEAHKDLVDYDFVAQYLHFMGETA